MATPEHASREREEPVRKRVFVEIGPHDLPVTWFGGKEFGEDEIYVGIDMNQRMLREGRDSTWDLRPNMHFVAGDAGKLPLKSASADEMYFGNVFGHPMLPDERKKNFLSEVRRVLRAGGVLVIKETNSPEDPRKLNHMLDEAGFAIERKVDAESSEWPLAVYPYDWLSAQEKQRDLHREGSSYIVFAKKRTE